MPQTKPHLPRLIARRMAKDRNAQSWSRPVVQMATIGVGLGVALMIVALAVVTGFQREIRELAIGFQSHITVLSGDISRPWVARDGEVERLLREVPGVENVTPFASLPGICETKEELAGVILKGTGPETNNELLLGALTEGRMPNSLTADSLVLSVVLARRLRLETGGRVAIYMVSDKGDIRPRVMTVAGLYDTGMLEFDEQFVFVPMGHLQRAGGWGVELLVTARGDTLAARAIGEPTGVVDWRHAGEEAVMLRGGGPFDGAAFPSGTELSVVLDGGNRWGTDTAWVTKRGPADWVVAHAGGAWRRRASGYEIRIADFRELQDIDDAVYQTLPFGWRTETVLASSPELFAWLSMLDLNVEVIIGLMVLIAIINMSSAMLIIILERRPMVGMLRALGMPVGQVMRIFVWHGARILGRGFLAGNALGLGLVALQALTGWVRLDPAAYYLDRVPVDLDVWTLVALELGAFVVSAGMLWLPGLASAQIRPAQTFRLR